MTESTDEVRTGNQAVDGVLESLAPLDDVPIEEHPAAFEAAHRALRDALDVPPAATDVPPG